MIGQLVVLSLRTYNSCASGQLHGMEGHSSFALIVVEEHIRGCTCLSMSISHRAAMCADVRQRNSYYLIGKRLSQVVPCAYSVPLDATLQTLHPSPLALRDPFQLRK
jgi:hypothetical protein